MPVYLIYPRDYPKIIGRRKIKKRVPVNKFFALRFRKSTKIKLFYTRFGSNNIVINIAYIIGTLRKNVDYIAGSVSVEHSL